MSWLLWLILVVKVECWILLNKWRRIICVTGHGGSDGLHGYVPSLDHVVADTVSCHCFYISCSISAIYPRILFRKDSIPIIFLELDVHSQVTSWKCDLYSTFIFLSSLSCLIRRPAKLPNILSLFVQGAFLEKVKFENPDIPCFLFGHSTGGAVVLKVRLLKWSNFNHSETRSTHWLFCSLAQAASYPHIENMLEGIILTSPALRVKPANPVVSVRRLLLFLI